MSSDDTSQAVAPVGRIFRPVQYLGSKLRSLEPLTAAITAATPSGSRVWDLFTGSTVVSQAIAGAGLSVLATDQLYSSSTFARAMLGTRRHCGDSTTGIAELIVGHSRLKSETGDIDEWNDWLDREDIALQEGDGSALLNLGAEIPQRWRTSASAQSRTLQARFERVADASTNRRQEFAGLLSSTYSGTYFGLRQTLQLENLRRSIHEMHADDRISAWHADCALTALSGAASSAVYSAGKHFAQPHRVRPGKDLTFHTQRCLSDRSVDIESEFSDKLSVILISARLGSEGHQALRGRFESGFSSSTIRRAGVGLIYADPPYTAQQYSRFYHLLEVLVTARPADLQRIKGEVTRGLYPTNRYLSPFCSRLQAPVALESMAMRARDGGASLVLSYSASMSGSTGNARTLTLEQIDQIMRQVYGPKKVEISTLSHRYRQFNLSAREAPGRDDSEFLIEGIA